MASAISRPSSESSTTRMRTRVSVIHPTPSHVRQPADVPDGIPESWRHLPGASFRADFGVHGGAHAIQGGFDGGQSVVRQTALSTVGHDENAIDDARRPAGGVKADGRTNAADLVEYAVRSGRRRDGFTRTSCQLVEIARCFLDLD